MSRIHVTIDRVVIAGMDAPSRVAFVRGLKAELAQRLADPVARAPWTRSRSTPVLHLGRMALCPDAQGARKLGGDVARGIGGRLKS